MIQDSTQRLAREALIELEISPAMSAVFLAGWYAGFERCIISATCPFTEDGIYRHEWTTAYHDGARRRRLYQQAVLDSIQPSLFAK